ncbi:MAG TPA: VOC family protein [Myxococcaceae bacterium]|nr:VOC family protein [Myxococcaceae bacterium]
MDMKLEVVVVPVSDVDRAKRFYEQLGWRLDADFVSGDRRVVQFTPPGSDASIWIGKGLTTSTPGGLKSLYLIVFDIEAARADLVRRGVSVSEIFHTPAPLARPFPARTRNGRATRPSPGSRTPTETSGCSRSYGSGSPDVVPLRLRADERLQRAADTVCGRPPRISEPVRGL